LLDELVQADVLDRYDDVVSECLDQPDLGVVEEPNLRAPEHDRSDHLAFAKHRHAEQRPITAGFPDVVERVLGIGGDVSDLDNATLEQRATDDRPTLRDIGALAYQVLEMGPEAPECDDSKDVALTPCDVAVVRTAQLDCAIDHGLQDCVEVECRARDRLD